MATDNIARAMAARALSGASGKTDSDDILTVVAGVKKELKEDISNKITKFYASNQGETHITDSDNGKIQGMMLYGKSSQDGAPAPENPVEIKSVVKPEIKVAGKNLLPFPYKNDSKTENGITFDVRNDGTVHVYGTANAIAYFNFTTGIEWGSESFSGENEKYKLCDIHYYNANNKILSIVIRTGETIERIFKPMVVLKTETDLSYEPYREQSVILPYTLNAIPVSSGGNVTIDGQQYIADYVDVERGRLVRMVDTSTIDSTQSIVDKTEWLLAEPQETDLTAEEIAAFKALTTYYPTTNISVNSEQLDGYTVFNYPISMANGWNYVKKQLNDNRDYIYDMDLQSAEAYVNSEYAVALTELEV